MKTTDYPADKNQSELYKSFPSTHFLSNQNNVLNMMAWCTFWRRNLHLFARDYLKLSLYPYQQIALYEMGISNFICMIASRNDAKSFMIALYACCRCILYPGTIFVIGSATKGQSKLMVSAKIQDELMQWSQPLAAEISDISTSANDTFVKFRNTSKIIVYTANDNARGNRSHASCREEFRQINKKIEDSVISPFQTVRNRPYMQKKIGDKLYGDIPVLQEDPVDIYISSSWIDDGNWMWGIVDQAFNGMLKKDGSVLLTFDESITLKHHLKTMKQMIRQKKKLDPVTWKTEILNLKVKDSMSSYFTYSMLMSRQILKHVFYPRRAEDFRIGKKNKYAIPKLDNEIRVVANDIAFVAGSQNDNSVYSCIRAIPESTTYGVDNNAVEVKQGYRRQYSYMESNQIGDTTLQAIRIRQLFEDFGGDYIVLDCRNGGLQILYSLQKVLYDEDRGVEYPPLKCMNNDDYARVCLDPNAPACIFAINATQNLNSDIAIGFRKNLVEKKIDFLVSYNTAKEEILSNSADYSNEPDPAVQVEYERPFLETQSMISECAELQYEKMPQTGVIKIHEQSSNRKDRYTACSYGSYFIDKLELDMIGSSNEYEYCCLVN
nr:MAG TPA: large terminase [Caudoviricetes sp.]